MEIEGLAELERSGLKQDDPKMYDKFRWILNIHTLDEWKYFKRSLSSEEKDRLIRAIIRMGRLGFKHLNYNHFCEFEGKIAYLNRCWNLPTIGN